MVVLTQKGENESLGKNIFRVTGGNERSLILIKPQGNDRVTARSLPQISWPAGAKKRTYPQFCIQIHPKSQQSLTNKFLEKSVTRKMAKRQTEYYLSIGHSCSSFHRPLLFKQLGREQNLGMSKEPNVHLTEEHISFLSKLETTFTQAKTTIGLFIGTVFRDEKK